jgi:hypothetical protein
MSNKGGKKMARIRKYMPLSRIVLIMAVVALVMGIVFIVQGVTKADWMRDAMRLEQVTLGFDEAAVARGELVDSAGEAQHAADTIREHRRGIASTYDELLAGGRFDAGNETHLTYAQALNMENYLYLAVLGFGLTDVVIASGAFMVTTGIALGATWMALRKSKEGEL